MALYFYYAPKIKNVSVTRHGALGIPSPNGAFLRITATREFCPFYQTSPGTAEVISNKCEIRYRYRMLPDGAYSTWTTILASSVTHTNEVTTDVMNVGLVSGESYEVIVGVKDDVGEANTSIVLTAGDVFMHRDGEKNSIGIGEAVAEENTVSIAAKMALKVKGLLSVAKEVLVGSGKFSSTRVDMHEEGYFGNFFMSLPQNAENPATAYLAHPYGGQLIANCGAGRVALTGLTAPVDASDATNKEYVDTNFAPAGYGLGVSPKYITFAEADTTYVSGWYRFSDTITVNGATYTYGYMRVDGFNHTACTQTLYIIDRGYKTFKRCRISATWYAWVDVTHTAFAPSGFGYGDEMLWLGFDTGSWSSTGNFQADLEATFAAMPQGTCKQVQFIDANLSNQKFAGTLWKYTGAYGYLTADNYSGAKAIKTYYNSVWNDWEWENPPMVADKEYRTTERWNNKAVYTMVIDCKTLPSQGQRSVTTKIPSSASLISAVGIAVSSDGESESMPCVSSTGAIKCAFFVTKSKNIAINVFTDMSSYNGYVTVKYTKN